VVLSILLVSCVADFSLYYVEALSGVAMLHNLLSSVVVQGVWWYRAELDPGRRTRRSTFDQKMGQWDILSDFAGPNSINPTWAPPPAVTRMSASKPRISRPGSPTSSSTPSTVLSSVVDSTVSLTVSLLTARLHDST
jgi:hypothetical protein